MNRRFARVVVRYRFAVLVGWVLLAGAATALLPDLSSADESPIGGLVSADASSFDVERRSLEAFRFPLLARTAVVQRDPGGLSAAEQERVVARALRINQRRDPLLETVVFALPIVNTLRLFPGSRESGTTAITYLLYKPTASLYARDALAHTYGSRIDGAGDALVGVTGPVPARLEQWRAIEDALPLVELATVGLIALIVGVAFRSPVAPLVVLAAAALAYLTAVRLVAFAGERLGVTVPREIEPVMVVLLLGVVTDYAVFFLGGIQRRLSEGRSPIAAGLDAMRRYVPLVFAAGIIVVFGTASLLVGELEFFRALGPGAALTVLVALAVGVTFVPAALTALGTLAYWPSLRPSAVDEEAAPSGLRMRVIGLVATRRGAVASTLVVAGALVGLALPLRSVDLGFTLLRGLPADSEVAEAAEAAQAGFAPGILSPTEVLVRGEGLRSKAASLVDLQRRLELRPGVAGVVGPRELPPEVGLEGFVTRDGSYARFAVVLDEDPLSARAIEHVRALRRALPRLLAAAGLAGATASLAGDTVLASETVDSTTGDLRRIAFAAMLVNVLLLALFLRALVAPLYLVAVSALTLAAALGLTTLFFEGVLGHADTTYYVPFAAGVLLLSFGSDYNFFVVGRIWQEAEHRSLPDAIAYAAPRVAGTVTVAGLALAFSFALLALVPLQPFREFAFAMCVGVLLDSLLVRSTLVPALIRVVGGRSWWPGR